MVVLILSALLSVLPAFTVLTAPVSPAPTPVTAAAAPAPTPAPDDQPVAHP